jgi:hypothetical protein
MNLIELNRALRQLRLGGIATVLEMRLHQAQVETMANRSLVSIWPPLLSSPAVKTRFFLVHLAAARVISRKPSGWLPSYKAIGCSTARLTPYSRNWPMPPSTYAQRTRRVVGCRAPTYHRRSWHAEATTHSGRDLLEIIMCRYERASTMITSNRPVEDWGKLLGDSAAVTGMLDRLLHHGHVLKRGPRSWRTKTDLPPQEAAG